MSHAIHGELLLLHSPRGGRSSTHAAPEPDVEEPVDDRVQGAVQERSRFGKRVDGSRNVVPVLGPDVDQMDDEVRSPTRDERTDDTQRHLDGLQFGLRDGIFVLHHAPQRDPIPVGGLLSLTPDNPGNVDVAEWDDEGWDDKDVAGHEGEVDLPLPPSRVSATDAAVPDLAVRIDADRFLFEDQQLRTGEEESQQPGHDDHLPGSRRQWPNTERLADGHISVDAHGGQDERRAGQCDDLDVEDELASDVTEHPTLFEHDEKQLGRHREREDGQITDRKVDDEDVYATVQLPVAIRRQERDDRDVPE